MRKDFLDYAMISAIAFAMGLVRAVVVPERRGAIGFVSAATVGLFCGLVAGVISREFGAATAWQYLFAAGFGIIGDRVVFWLLTKTAGEVSKTINIQASEVTMGNHTNNSTNISDIDGSQITTNGSKAGIVAFVVAGLIGIAALAFALNGKFSIQDGDRQVEIEGQQE